MASAAERLRAAAQMDESPFFGRRNFATVSTADLAEVLRRLERLEEGAPAPVETCICGGKRKAQKKRTWKLSG